MINIDYKNTVAVVELRRGKTNALDLELVGNLQKSLQQLKADPGVRGVVLASASEKFFSIGFDIPQLFELAREDFITTSIRSAWNYILCQNPLLPPLMVTPLPEDVS